jgi:hypothetical protein
MATALLGGSEKPTEVTVRSGSIVSGNDFLLNATRTVTIHGTLHTDVGMLTEPVALWIMEPTGEWAHNGNGKDGAFEIADVGPGTYKISAETVNGRGARGARLFGVTTVAVRDTSVNGVDIMLRPSPKLEGQIRMEGGSALDSKLPRASTTKSRRTASGRTFRPLKTPWRIAWTSANSSRSIAPRPKANANTHPLKW